MSFIRPVYKNRPKRIPTLNSVIFSPTYVVFSAECSENMSLLEIGSVKPVIVHKSHFLCFLSTFIKVVTGDLHIIRESIDVIRGAFKF